MATIYNSDLTKEIRDGAKIQVSVDNIPSQLADKVVPVMEVNPKLLRRVNIIRHNNSTNATTVTIYTTPSDRDFYLTSATLSTHKDATSTALFSALSATIGGLTTYFMQLGFLSLTADSKSIALNFSIPIKVDRGSNIQVLNSTAVANVTSFASITGYIDDLGSA
jgi:hypothetical protein